MSFKMKKLILGVVNASWMLMPCLILALFWPLTGLTQSTGDGYHPDLDGQVHAMVLQDDGKLLIGGEFTTVNGISRQALARLHADGSLDTSFNAQLGNGTVFAIALQDNGQILIGGNFTQVGVSARNRIARLNANGSLDSGFNPNASTSVRALAIQADGRILVGGNFVTIGGGSQQRLARLNVNGSLDGSFTPALDGSSVRAIRIQSNGRILVGGIFNSVNSASHPNIVRLHSNGSIDSSFYANAGDVVSSIDLQTDGRILIGGDFLVINGSTRWGFARLMANGDTDFSVDAYNFNNSVFSVRALLDGRILVAGRFTQINGNGCEQVARIHYNGTLDRCFHGFYSGGTARASAEQSDGKVVVGSFNAYNGGQRLHRWDQSDQRDENSQATPDGPVYTLSVDPQGRIMIGGQFTETTPGWEARNLARLNHVFAIKEHSLGDPDPDGQVYSVSMQSDGKALVGGFFNTISGQTRPYLVRLLANGDLDWPFNPAPNGGVTAMLMQPDGKILVAGLFDQIGGAPRASLARLNPNGSLDGAFDVPVDEHELLDGQVLTMALQPDGRILIGGTFVQIGQTFRHGLARLMPDGSLDTGFAPQTAHVAFVTAMQVQGDGRILFSDGGGVYRLNANGSVDTSFGPVFINGTVTSMMVTAGGRILIGGQFEAVNGITRMHLARLEADGGLDADFLANVSGTSINALGLHHDGRILVGGSFNGIAGATRTNFERISVPDSALQSLKLEQDRVRWMLDGAVQQPAMAPELQFSLNGSSFNTIAAMQPISGGWQVTGFEPPYQQVFYLRIRAPVQQGYRNGSMGLMHSPVHQFYLIEDRLFSDRFE